MRTLLIVLCALATPALADPWIDRVVALQIGTGGGAVAGRSRVRA